DGGGLIFSKNEGRRLIAEEGVDPELVREYYGSEELIHAKPRACFWIEEDQLSIVESNRAIAARLQQVREARLDKKTAPSTRPHARTPHRFVQISAKTGDRAIVVPAISSENRPYLPVGHLLSGPIISSKCYAMYDEPLWNFS